MFLVAVLFICYCSLLIGKRATEKVQDEIVPARPYLTILLDSLLVIGIGVFFAILQHPVIAIVVPLILLLLRTRFSFEHAYLPLLGVLVGASYGMVPLVFLAIAFCYVYGALAQSLPTVAVRGLVVPIAGLAGSLVLTV